VKTLVLWDIDCTLIDSGGAGERSLILALERAFGITDTLSWLEYFGRTDLWIARTILQHHFKRASAEEVNKFLEAYLSGLGEAMHNPRARVLPGVDSILKSTGPEQGVAHGLLTGNLKRGAEIKLRHLGLWQHFPFGAFADDAEDRNCLGPFALRRAAQHHSFTFAPANIVVIGDTPHDIACGKAIGARTVAVATGRYSLDTLLTHGPDIALHDLSDSERLVEGLL
jgi:phosphoglycolate phosphatase-like HAD superfamily hydrolase